MFWGAVAVCLLSGSVYSALAQQINLPDADRKKLHFGFSFGGFYSWADAKRASALQTDTALVAIEPMVSQGFSLGLVVNVGLPDEHWDVRFTPNVSFYNREAQLTFRSAPAEIRQSQQTMAELPLMFRFKSNRRRNHRLFMFAGLNPSIEVASVYDEDPDERLEYAGYNMEVVYGFGLDQYAPFFRFVPEVRFSHGVTGFLGASEGAFARNLRRLSTHRVALIVNFEG